MIPEKLLARIEEIEQVEEKNPKKKQLSAADEQYRKIMKK